MKKILYCSCLPLLLAMWGCSEFNEEPQGEKIIPGRAVRLTLNISAGGNAIITPSSRSLDENAIRDLNIFIFNTDGMLLDQSYYSAITGNTISINTTSGYRNIGVVANWGSQMTTVTSQPDFNDALFTPTSPLSPAFCPMSALQTNVAIPVGKTVSIAPITVSRLYSKVTVTFNSRGVTPGVVIRPTKIVLCQVPKSCHLCNTNIPTANLLLRGDSLAAATGLFFDKHATATPLYLLENMQGDNGTTTDERYKTPASGKASLCSYLEVTADYSSPKKKGVVVYRYYLGKNVLTNFDMQRNTWYQISIAFNGQGGIAENTWRVNTQGLIEERAEQALYLPWHLGQARYFTLPADVNTDAISQNNGDNMVVASVDSLKIFLCKADNEASPKLNNCIESATTNTTYNVYQHGYDDDQSIQVDVSALFFPQNATFGRSNYPITQYITLVETYLNTPQWAATTNADWVYLGDGRQTRSFLTLGIADASGTANMQNRIRSEDLTGSTIAVRCSANPTNRERRAQIIFTDLSGNELARVFVAQNPSSYPTSAVALSYVPGGVFKAGAFDCMGNTPTKPATQSSRTPVFPQVGSFYLARTECSVQQFCDYLNDMLIVSFDQLTNHNHLLDKSGDIDTDYPGKNNSSGNLRSVMTTPRPVVLYLSGWHPAPQSILLTSSTATPTQFPCSNYPLFGIDFYGACDYNYWLLKYAGKSPTRSSRMLPTEMEWEAAARGIDNRFTTRAQFIASTTNRKNGTYPYAFADNGCNSGLNGTESALAILRNIAWFTYGVQPWRVSAHAMVRTGMPQSPHPCATLYPNALGLYDMNGNVDEWVMDNATPSDDLHFVANKDIGNVCNYESSSKRVIRGGGSAATANYISNTIRDSREADQCDEGVGFRPIIRE